MAGKVYVGNLSYNTTQETLQQAFSRSGTVTEVKVMIDRETGRSRGFGFVSFASDDQASQAIQDWNGQEVDGRRLTVNEAQDRRPASGGFEPRQNRPYNTPAVSSERFSSSSPNQSSVPRGGGDRSSYSNDSRGGGRPPRDRDRGRRSWQNDD